MNLMKPSVVFSAQVEASVIHLLQLDLQVR